MTRLFIVSIKNLLTAILEDYALNGTRDDLELPPSIKYDPDSNRWIIREEEGGADEADRGQQGEEEETGPLKTPLPIDRETWKEVGSLHMP